MENLIKIDDLGVPLFLETPIYTLHWYFPDCLDDVMIFDDQGAHYTNIGHKFRLWD